MEQGNFDGAGNLYGTTVGGGSGTYDSGTVFELERDPTGWTEKVLFAFDFNDGVRPTAGVIEDATGNLYGTADVAFELSQGSGEWTETELHYFTGEHGDGLPPVFDLISDTSGKLYGTTYYGGYGVVFELVQKGVRWEEWVLYRFAGIPHDGAEPSSGVTLDSSGNLYGTTAIGGGTGCNGGCGTVYKLTRGAKGRWRERLLHTFGKGQNGNAPDGGVVVDKAGNLYGTTAYGGSGCDCGVIYKLTPGPKGKWRYTVLHAFTGIDGAVPTGGLTLDSKGNLYGGTALGGTTGNGIIFELTP